jgi:hypothetical protein
MSKVYLHATLKIRHGHMDRFVEAYREQVPVLTGLGWTLKLGMTNVFGRIYTIVNVWEIPDAQTFFDSVGAWRDSPQGQAFRAVTRETVEEEVLQLMRGLPYAEG